MLENYIKYLKIVDSKLQKFFEIQKPYIFCKEGCANCCKNAQFPYSRIEMLYLLEGAVKLSEEIQNKINDNVARILEEKKNFKGKVFKYECPFLINNSCCIYEYRGLVCRSFGLISIGDDDKIKAPFCCFQGYNYSNVIKKGDNKISQELWEKSGIQQEPKAYNVSYKFLTKPDFEEGFGFIFGEKKPLIDWLIPRDAE